MDVAAKQTASRTPAPAHLVPSIVAPTELSGRPDNSERHPVRLAESRQTHPSLALADRGSSDRERVAAAAAWIRNKVAVTLRKGAEDVGEYILSTFFGGDKRLARLRSPFKHASYRALAAKCGTPELPISKTWLNNAVGIALIARALPASTSAFRTLPPSYQEALLPVRDPEVVERLAQEAVDSAVTCRELRKIVAKNMPRNASAKRLHRGQESAAPQAIRDLIACFEARMGKHGLSQDNIERMSVADRRRSLRLLDSLTGQLGRLRDALNKGIDQGQ